MLQILIHGQWCITGKSLNESLCASTMLLVFISPMRKRRIKKLDEFGWILICTLLHPKPRIFGKLFWQSIDLIIYISTIDILYRECRLGGGVCPKAVAKGFRCIFSNQGVWYLDHLDVPWDEVYGAEPLEGINGVTEQELVLGGEVCMWAETADTSNVQQTIWPRAAAAAGMHLTNIIISTDC